MQGGVGTTRSVTMPRQSVVMALHPSSRSRRLAVMNERAELRLSCLVGSTIFLAWRRVWFATSWTSSFSGILANRSLRELRGTRRTWVPRFSSTSSERLSPLTTSKRVSSNCRLARTMRNACLTAGASSEEITCTPGWRENRSTCCVNDVPMGEKTMVGIPALEMVSAQPQQLRCCRLTRTASGFSAWTFFTKPATASSLSRGSASCRSSTPTSWAY